MQDCEETRVQKRPAGSKTMKGCIKSDNALLLTRDTRLVIKF